MEKHLCKNCGHEIEKNVFKSWLHATPTIPPNFSKRQISSIVTCVCGCHKPEPICNNKTIKKEDWEISHDKEQEYLMKLSIGKETTK